MNNLRNSCRSCPKFTDDINYSPIDAASISLFHTAKSLKLSLFGLYIDINIYIDMLSRCISYNKTESQIVVKKILKKQIASIFLFIFSSPQNRVTTIGCPTICTLLAHYLNVNVSGMGIFRISTQLELIIGVWKSSHV